MMYSLLKEKKWNPLPDGMTALTDWHTDQVIEDVITDLQEEYNYTRAYATDMVYSGGYRIYSTMDPKVQKSLKRLMLIPPHSHR